MSLLAQGFNLGDKLQLQPGRPLVGVAAGTVGSTFGTLSSFINLLLPMAFIIAGLIFLFLLIGGGFTIVSSAGNPKGVEQGKNQLMTAVIGFIVIFSAFWIIQIIETFTGVKIFNSGL
ncbi:MAG TPA: hypothetical protein VLH19_04490 [Patescibacteria group bacterium]|nr:hypothetical protein [Patescibacteria group bacterium]